MQYSSQPTYEELKRGSGRGGAGGKNSSQPTYEELKPVGANSFPEFCLFSAYL